MSVQQFDASIAKEVADSLVQVEAIKINPSEPFTWASGWKSPIYCDNRLSLSYPETRNMIRDSFVKLIKSKYKNAEVIAGVATAGIPQGALVADALGLPFIYIRSTAKSHGMENQIEGKVTRDANVVLIEDLVSTGGSALQAAEAIRTAGMDVIGMASIFTYGFGIAEENFRKHNIDLWYLSDYNTVISLLVENGQIPAKQVAALESWRSNPSQWDDEMKEDQ